MKSHSRRSFIAELFGSQLAGASVLQLGFLRATQARAQSKGAPTNLFDIPRVADGVYAAIARPAALLNCNAAIFENSDSLVIVDAHSKSSAAASLAAQLRKEVTQKPI